MSDPPANLILSLFPGIGLLDRAFEELGFCVVRGPDVLWGGDVHRLHPPPARFDGVIGGPPCQAFSSLASLVRASGREPRFGNLIPEFERCVVEAQPAWFLMENVPQAPLPAPAGYGVKAFLLDHSALNDGTGHGLEQRRMRRFSFGMRGVTEPPSLLRWIDLAVFLLPDAARACGNNGKDGKPARVGSGLSQPVDNSDEAKGRVPAVDGGHDQTPSRRGARAVRAGAVTGSDGGPSERMGRYKLADALRLQGLPEDFLSDAPFTAEGKLKAVANGVPLPMGCAVVGAIKKALAMMKEQA